MSYLLATPFGYYFRLTVPAELRTIFEKRELKLSLKTASKRHASLLAAVYALRCKLLFDHLRTSTMTAFIDNKILFRGVKIAADGSLSIDDLFLDPEHADADSKLFTQTLSTLRQQVTPESTPTVAESRKKFTVAEAVESFSNEKLAQRRWSSKSASDNSASFKLLVEFFEDRSVADISRSDAVEYLEALKTVPRLRNRDPKYTARPIRQFSQLNISDPITAATINKHLSRAAELFNWLHASNFITTNPFLKLQITDNRLESEIRSAFTEKDLLAMFSSSQFAAYRKENNHKYWLPILALYTGCRLEELCKLRVCDIGTENGIHFLNITGNVKTKSSHRRVPIHTALIEVGFLSFVDSQKQKRLQRIFPDLKANKFGKYSHSVASSWFPRFRRAVGIPDSEKKCFHSFRHFFADSLKQHEVSEPIAAAILGHKAPGGISYRRYGKQYGLDLLSVNVNLVGLPSVLAVLRSKLDAVCF